MKLYRNPPKHGFIYKNIWPDELENLKQWVYNLYFPKEKPILNDTKSISSKSIMWVAWKPKFWGKPTASFNGFF